MKEKLATIGLYTIGDIKELSDEQIQHLPINTRGLSSSALLGFRDNAKDALAGSYISTFVDHKKAENPYLSLYGNTWCDKINESVTLKGTCCITVLIEHMVKESKSILKGSKWETKMMFYHDALSQLTCEDTKNWMKDKGFYDHWVLPKLGLNEGTVFANRPVGNSPEMMPWDCSLNKDVDDLFIQHKAWTNSLPESNPKRFSKSTPARQDHGYLRLLDPIHGPLGGTPTSKRIIQDVEKCMGNHLLKIIAAKGAIVPGLGNRNGRRRVDGIVKRGGKRSKGAYRPVSWVHPDAVEAR